MLRGSCTNWGSRTKEEYIPTPTSTATRFVVQTPRIRIILMSTSGSFAPSSVLTQATRLRTPSAIRPSVLADPQPHALVWLTATSTRTRPVDISAAARQLMWPGSLTGEGGTKKCVATAATRIARSGSQNSQW